MKKYDVSQCGDPGVPLGTSMEFIAHVKINDSTVTKRALHYANGLETNVPGGLEVYSGWCKFLQDGTRVGGINEHESVIAWESARQFGAVTWIKGQIEPAVAKGCIQEFLVAIKRFGESRTNTQVAWFANDYEDHMEPVTRGFARYRGWVTNPTFRTGPLCTIGDKIVAWAELPECTVEID